MKKIETSKLLLMFLVVYTLSFTVYNCWLAYELRDLQAMNILAGTVPAAFTIVASFITKKSERENIIKHNIDKLIKLHKENQDIDNIAQIIEQAIQIEKGGNSGYNGY